MKPTERALEREPGPPAQHGPRSASAPLLEEAPVGDPAVPRYELAQWAERFGLIAGITARGPGFSLGLWSDEAVGQVMTRWRALRAALGPRFPTLVLSHQVHATAVEWHDQAPEGIVLFDGLDGHATARTGVLLTVTVADCIPVYVAAPARGAIALVHAGWRGAAARVLTRAVELLRERAAVAPGELVIHCGVGICGACYEVGPEVAGRFGGGASGGPEQLDLRTHLVAEARSLGIEHVTVSPWCSAHDRERFYSHRASRGRDGRMVAYLGRPHATGTA